ncbi:hypothetical protein QOZ80_8BG0659450 [Eleusine coracana subsp. coracana]|nr:hypothetical protein QOZ80_8BG0659450 [Eleusine coracana subsp. coracana]
MAVADGVVPWPPPPPPPASRNITASLARSHLVRAAADTVTGAVVCLFFASLWLVGAGAALSVIRSRACGDASAVVAVASKVIQVSCITIVLACPLSLVMMVTRMGCSGSVPVAEEDDQASVRKSIATVAREVLRDTLALAIIASSAFVLLMAVGELLKGSKSSKGTRRDRISSLISDVGSLGAEALYCLLILPVSAKRIWKFWFMPRSGQ